ncbi:hypothetical protein C7974DRAFT_411284 [Boeremia exigua]|uniref:uncharacterized protein n=1 Tax=Boeremia exigua TaxID=749465 RepID=UPI001E8CAE32|nr:uncharacterized protein C7974DRAFT_411284 [Boeremia exigua]KAH6637822.1 hypothetical protein C7974DRAFT_411284 [Boeremia exigua]
MSNYSFNLPSTAGFAQASSESAVTSITLDPKSSAVLAATIKSGSNLPANRDHFEQLHNRQAFEQVLERDMGVYDRLAINFESIHNLCEGFTERGAPMMTVTGSIIGSTSQRAIVFMEQIKSLLENGFDDESRTRVLDSLDDLTARAKSLAFKSEKTSKVLATFKVDSSNRFDELRSTMSRWDEVALSSEEINNRIRDHTDRVRQVIDQARMQAQAAQEEQERSQVWGKAKWGFMAFPLLGAAILIGDHVAGPNADELRARTEELQRNYEEMIRKEGKDQEQLIAAKMNVDLLHNTMEDMSVQADDLSSALKQIYTAATKMVTENEDLARRIKALDEDLDDAEQDLQSSNMDAIRDMLTDSLEDVVECIAMWQQVHQVGQEFERGGELAGSYSVLPDFAEMQMPTGWEYF